MSTPPVMSINDELLAELGAAAGADAQGAAPVRSVVVLALLAHIADLKQQLVAAGITAELMRGALEQLSMVPGCGCSFPCRCGGDEWTRAELEGRIDLAIETLEAMQEAAP